MDLNSERPYTGANFDGNNDPSHYRLIEELASTAERNPSGKAESEHLGDTRSQVGTDLFAEESACSGSQFADDDLCPSDLEFEIDFDMEPSSQSNGNMLHPSLRRREIKVPRRRRLPKTEGDPTSQADQWKGKKKAEGSATNWGSSDVQITVEDFDPGPRKRMKQSQDADPELAGAGDGMDIQYSKGDLEIEEDTEMQDAE